MSKHWMERVTDRALKDIARSKARMKLTIAPAALRRPNTSVLLQEAIGNPEGVTPQGRERLAEFLTEKYGEAAKSVFPYLGIEEPDDPEAPF